LTAEGPAWRSARAWILLLAVFLVGVVLDLASKSIAFERVACEPMDLSNREVVAEPSFRLPWHEGVRAIPPDLLDFHLVVNHGAVFGIGQNARGIFIAFTVLAVTVGVAIFGWWTKATSRWTHIAIGLILAGGIGNLYDRVAFGAVRDFLYLFPRRVLPWELAWPGGSREIFPWVFNVADMLLLAGMAILLLRSRGDERTPRGQQAGSPSRSPSGS